MNWKPEICKLGKSWKFLRWMHGNGAITFGWRGLYASYKHYVFGFGPSGKDWLVGVQFAHGGGSVWIHLTPLLQVYFHWPTKEFKCAIKATSSRSTSPLSAI